MIDIAMTEGGMQNEDAILAAKRHIEEIDMKSQFSQRMRKQAREANDRGLKYLQNSQWGEAAREFKTAAQADAADVEIMNNLAYALMRVGEWHEAKRFLTIALEFAPGRTSAWENLGDVFAKEEKMDKAVACFAQAYRFSRNRDTTWQFF